jgi:hypothetical protein
VRARLRLARGAASCQFRDNTFFLYAREYFQRNGYLLGVPKNNPLAEDPKTGAACGARGMF